MAQETPQSELKRLLIEQNKMRQNEVFCGLSPAERVEYEARSERIHILGRQIQTGAADEQTVPSAKANQQFHWNRAPETDTHQADSRQSYRSREEGSAGDTDSKTQKGNPKKSPREQEGK